MDWKSFFIVLVFCYLVFVSSNHVSETFKVDKTNFKRFKVFLIILVFRCKIEKLSDISSSKKFLNSSDKMYGVLRF